ncbi:MAG: hypothetical protein J6X62_05445 [Bacteroidales bacterium]|nr:hypothetical protein [Bacteroidales bacterium]
MVKKSRTIKALALIAVLGTMAAGCQKETMVEPQTSVAEVGAVRHVHYTVNGELRQEKLVGEEAWNDFLYRMLALAERGYTVRILNGNRTTQVSASKEVVTYTTTDKAAAFTWCDNMHSQGYDVTIEYNEETGVYTCIAVK